MAGQPSRSVRLQPYRIDFSAVCAGKRIASTKRRIRWRFGFPNSEAVEAGMTGTDCRGEEHEIVVVWSVTSGKIQIMMDNSEVLFSVTRDSVVDHSWAGRGDHVMKIVCHANPPMSATPNFHQYDLYVDGQSFFKMRKVFELGVRGAGGPVRNKRPYETEPPTEGGYEVAYGRSRVPNAPIRAESGAHAMPEYPPPPEVAERPQPIAAAVEEPAPAPVADLLDFASSVPPAASSAITEFSGPPQPAPPSAPTSMALGNGGAGQMTGFSGGAVAASPPQQSFHSYQTHGAPAYNTAMVPSHPPPAPPSTDQFAPQPPSHSDISSEIMNAYSTSVAVAAPPLQTSSTAQYATPEPSATMPLPYDQSFAQATASTPAIAPPENELSSFDAALKKLVNVDHIDEPVEQTLQLTLKQKEVKKVQKKSEPIAPVANEMVGTAATLSQIKAVKPESAVPKENIMNAPPQLFQGNAAAAGMLVVHGQAGGGPPSLQQPHGYYQHGGFAGYGVQAYTPPRTSAY